MKNGCRLLMGVLLLFILLFCNKEQSLAADTNENISVTVPAALDIVFNEDGSNTVSDFVIANQSLVPIYVTNMRISEYNDWKLVSNDALIYVDSKQVVLKMGDQCLYAGDNIINATVAENSHREFEITVRRGAWTNYHASEKAFGLEVEYTAGSKVFQINLDGNGSEESLQPISANNGETVNLPVPTKVKYRFKGWKDSQGVLYNGQFVVPIGGASLVAEWEATTAYAIFSADDTSLTFVRSVEPIVEGSIYNGKTATYVYTGFEDDIYVQYSQVPWWIIDGNYGTLITKVVVQDVIQPKGTAYWFFCMTNCFYYDLEKLDVSQTTDMTSMFSSAAEHATDTVQVIGAGKWDVSNVQSFACTFRGLAENAATLLLDDLSGWDTANATDMLQMFNRTGVASGWSMDCRSWNVDKVTSYSMFNYKKDDKIIPPNWVH